MESLDKQKKIAVIDFGGQYAHLIASRIRRLGAYTEIVSNEESIEVYKNYSGIILSGGPESVYEQNAPSLSEEFWQLDLPILGICYGHQLIMKHLGGTVSQAETHEYGRATIRVEQNEPSPLGRGLQAEEVVWMSHGDEVEKIPPGFVKFASSKNCRFAGVYHPEKQITGLQFHPEVTHTPNGNTLLANFIELCGLSRSWDLHQFLQLKLEQIRTQVQDKKVFMLVSGGVDSTVAYSLLARALGSERVRGLLVDTGFMRKAEVEDLNSNLHTMSIDLNIANESERYYKALEGVSDPEKKREIIGQLFMDIQEEYSQQFGLNPQEWILGQGTIYPDTIESGGTKHAHNIKTHHNRVAKVLEMLDKGLIIEPIRELYKDEVRALGALLGIDKKWTMRHPFPGPGLAVRMLAATFPPPQDIQQIRRVLKDYPQVHYQIPPIHSVGVQGDRRSYRHCAILNDFSQDWSVLNEVSVHLTNEIQEINRVIFEPFETENVQPLQADPFALDREHADLLREADDKVHKILVVEELMDEIWQFPVVLLPFGKTADTFSIVLRPVESTEAMTANFYGMEREILQKIVQSLLEVEKISAVYYDITNKPPGTIEWE